MAQLHVGRDVLTVLPVHSPVLDNIRNKEPIVTDSWRMCFEKVLYIIYRPRPRLTEALTVRETMSIDH